MKILSLMGLTCCLLACSSFAQKPRALNAADLRNAQPKQEKLSRYGNPEIYHVYGKAYRPLKTPKNYRKRGIASWYGPKFHGKLTSNREVYNMYAMTAAHKTLPIPCYVKVTNLENKRSVIVRVNDRGPFISGRIIDLSYAAAYKIGVIKKGTATVMVEHIPSHSTEKSRFPNEKTFIQAGAFSNKKNAFKLHKKLNAHGLAPVFIKQTQINQESLYLVQIGPLLKTNTIAETQLTLARLGMRYIYLKQ